MIQFAQSLLEENTQQLTSRMGFVESCSCGKQLVSRILSWLFILFQKNQDLYILLMHLNLIQCIPCFGNQGTILYPLIYFLFCQSMTPTIFDYCANDVDFSFNWRQLNVLDPYFALPFEAFI
ncbi:unnamed protein product [Paramecium sonneborni]|uniref:Uncharacterized protein n=1 Tax=Paramecium sonneborni TaxID=65129 RepID=A0A8S1MM30_9CILI|nr:unnamed protein product [Paramecium sonneborni]